MELKSLLTELKFIVYDMLVENKVRIITQSVRFEEDRKLAYILRNVHSIEKGLSLDKPRKGFGIEKINELMDCLNEYYSKDGDFSRPHVLMAVDAISEYLAYHDGIGYSNAKIDTIRENYYELLKKVPKHDIKYGGTITIDKNRVTDVEKEYVEHFLKNRHSVRQFSGERVPLEDVKKAVELAYRAPSACNRQATRVYIVPSNKKEILADWVEGVGGFQNEVDTFIMITGKRSYYYQSEHFQYIVTASILTGYLALTLELYDIGSCVLQRPVAYSKKWNNLQKVMGIPEDEQIVAFLGCGMLRENYKVPVSNRLPFEEIGRII